MFRTGESYFVVHRLSRLDSGSQYLCRTWQSLREAARAITVFSNWAAVWQVVYACHGRRYPIQSIIVLVPGCLRGYRPNQVVQSAVEQLLHHHWGICGRNMLRGIANRPVRDNLISLQSLRHYYNGILKSKRTFQPSLTSFLDVPFVRFVSWTSLWTRTVLGHVAYSHQWLKQALCG